MEYNGGRTGAYWDVDALVGSCMHGSHRDMVSKQLASTMSNDVLQVEYDQGDASMSYNKRLDVVH